jgi:acetyl-CoA synthetase
VWVHGDFASRDADGMWYVHGRSDDTLKIAGKRTGPSEIEALLMATGLGGAFRPAEVALVPDLPRTRNMKVMRRVIRAAWLGEDPGDLGTLVNPESVQAVRAARH